MKIIDTVYTDTEIDKIDQLCFIFNGSEIGINPDGSTSTTEWSFGLLPSTYYETRHYRIKIIYEK